jgi:hypothetical protein
LGAFSDKTLDFFDLLASWSSRRDSNSRASVKFNLLLRDSCLVQRYNARMSLNCI